MDKKVVVYRILDQLSFYKEKYKNRISKFKNSDSITSNNNFVYGLKLKKRNKDYFLFIEDTIRKILDTVFDGRKYEKSFGMKKHSKYLNDEYCKINKILEILKPNLRIMNVELPNLIEHRTIYCLEKIDKVHEFGNLLLEFNEYLERYAKLNNIYNLNELSFKRENLIFSDDVDKESNTIVQLLNKKLEMDLLGLETDKFYNYLSKLLSATTLLLNIRYVDDVEYYSDKNNNIYLDYNEYLYEIAKSNLWAVNQNIGYDNLMNCPDEIIKELSKLVNLQFDANRQNSSNDSEAEESDLVILPSEDNRQNSSNYSGTKKNDLELDIKTSSEEKLNKLIGLSKVKEYINKIKAYAIANKNSKMINLHMCFTGNPGCGKTEVARLIAGILYENKILPRNKCIEIDGRGLIGQYVGETDKKTKRIIESAMGGVLFIDEAYIMGDDAGFGYGDEAIATLIKEMEDKRGKLCIILAGYRNEMEKMLKTNPGFNSRIQFNINFDNYSREELGQICDLFLDKYKYLITGEAKNRLLDITDVSRKKQDFANAREIRNIIEQTIMNLNLRDINSKEIEIDDIEKFISDNNIYIPKNKSIMLTPIEQLNALVGLNKVKELVLKIKAWGIKNKDSVLNTHMCFYGNPGTGKTEVARIISSILYEIGVLKEAKMIETNANGLIGEYVGSTGPKTEKIFNDALGGVLFIDEAYELESKRQGYGQEALSTLLKLMEDNRGKICVIFAGYKNEIKRMLSSNPGLESRIQFELNFDNYNEYELKELCKIFISKCGLIATDDIVEKIVKISLGEKDKETYANARTLRNIIDKIVLNQNYRTSSIDDNHILDDDVDEYIKEYCSDFEEKSNNTYDFSRLNELYKNFDFKNFDFNYLEESVVSISGNGSEGTGFIISDDGLCLTCNHCISMDWQNQNLRIIYHLKNKKIKTYYKFNLLCRDITNDLAIIKIEDVEDCLFLALEGEDFAYKVLHEFITAGYPFGGESYDTISITDGKVASINKYDSRNVVFANMFGKPGSSGSPIIDKSSKKVIGVFWGGISKNDQFIPCFTPIKEIRNFLK